MKVYIGPHKNWVGPYQIANLLKYVGFNEDRCHSIGKWLSETPLNTFCEWIHSKKKRKVKVRYHEYDIWSLDVTLAHIILPGLKQLRATKHGYPSTDLEDAPHIPDSTEEGVPPSFVLERWHFIMDEIIWAFENFLKDVDDPCSDPHQIIDNEKRMQNGFRLFGKYYQALWN